MKSLLVFLIIPVLLFTQIPEGYYDTAEGKKGEDLKSALHEIIKDHKVYKYTDMKRLDVWKLVKDTDKDPNDPEYLVLIYTGEKFKASIGYNFGSGWSREHVWSQSHGYFGRDEKKGAGTDIHHIRAILNKINKKKSNRFFDFGDKEYYFEGKNTGCKYNDTNWTWEPIDAHKGDVARMLFYMAVRYEGEGVEPDLELVNAYPKKKRRSRTPFYGKLNALLVWHGQDPPDDFERQRHELIFKYQNNRNPFIDYPEYAWLIWGYSVN